MGFSRTDRSLVAQWWFTVDRGLLGAVLALIATGVLLSLAAGTAVAARKGLDPLHFTERHALFAVLAVALAIGVSLLSPRQVRRLALVLMAGTLVLMVAVLVQGPEINGARRWFRILGHSVQPSELAKPAFVVLTASLLAAGQRSANAVAGGLLAVTLTLLVLQPDIGHALLFSAVWGALLVLSGLPLMWAGVLLALGCLGLGFAYAAFPHVKGRIDRFLDPSTGDTFQVSRAYQSFQEGGFFGRGPGEGTIKTVLPDAHTDFVFAVIAEEYGAVACLALLVLIAFIVLRPMLSVIGATSGTADDAGDGPDPRRVRFGSLAVAGLSLMLGLQALINMAVNVGLVPAKGMTLPFISNGGSSTLASGLVAGMLLALTRRQSGAVRPKKPTFVTSAGGIEIIVR